MFQNGFLHFLKVNDNTKIKNTIEDSMNGDDNILPYFLGELNEMNQCVAQILQSQTPSLYKSELEKILPSSQLSFQEPSAAIASLNGYINDLPDLASGIPSQERIKLSKIFSGDRLKVEIGWHKIYQYLRKNYPNELGPGPLDLSDAQLTEFANQLTRKLNSLDEASFDNGIQNLDEKMDFLIQSRELIYRLTGIQELPNWKKKSTGDFPESDRNISSKELDRSEKNTITTDSLENFATIVTKEYRDLGFGLGLGFFATPFLLINVEIPFGRTLIEMIDSGLFGQLTQFSRELFWGAVASFAAGLLGLAMILLGNIRIEFDPIMKKMTRTRFPVKVFKKQYSFNDFTKLKVEEEYHETSSKTTGAKTRSWYTYNFLLIGKRHNIQLGRVGADDNYLGQAGALAAILGIPATIQYTTFNSSSGKEVSINEKSEFKPRLSTIGRNGIIFGTVFYGLCGLFVLSSFGYSYWEINKKLPDELAHLGGLNHGYGQPGDLMGMRILDNYARFRIPFLEFSGDGSTLTSVGCNNHHWPECQNNPEDAHTFAWDLTSNQITSRKVGLPEEETPWFTMEQEMYTMWQIMRIENPKSEFKLKGMPCKEDWQILSEEPIFEQCFHAIAKNPSADVVAIAYRSTVMFIQTEPLKPLSVVPDGTPDYGGYTPVIEFSPDGKYAAISRGARNKDSVPLTRVWEVATGKLQLELNTATRTPYQIDWSPENYYLVLLYNGGISILDVLSGKVIKTYEGHYGGTSSVAWHPNGKSIYSGGGDRLIRVWKAPDSK
jgi:hypothetical protein